MTMALLQSSLMHFLFEGRISRDQAVNAPTGPEVHGKASDIPVEVCGTPITHVVADSAGSNAPKLHEPALSS